VVSLNGAHAQQKPRKTKKETWDEADGQRLKWSVAYLSVNYSPSKETYTKTRRARQSVSASIVR